MELCIGKNGGGSLAVDAITTADWIQGMFEKALELLWKLAHLYYRRCAACFCALDQRSGFCDACR